MSSTRRRTSLIVHRLVGCIIGIIATFAVIGAMEWLGALLFPFDPDIEIADSVHMAEAMAAVPLPSKLVVVFGWFLGTLIGAAVALRLSQWRPSGWIIAAVTIAGGIVNLLALPHPLWMQFATFVAPLAGTWLAERRFHHARRGDPLIG